MKLYTYPIPATRDPFVNTPLIPAGYDPDTGEERFWISTWNDNVGCLGALITPSGKHRIYRIKKGERGIIGCGGYSACLTDNDTLWIISDLQAFCRLTLSTGEYTFFDTGAEQGLVFAGMQYDPATKKLLAFAFAYPRLQGISFDTERCCTVQLYEYFTDASSLLGGFANGNGTYTVNLTGNGPAQFYRWNPTAETLIHWKRSGCEAQECVKTVKDVAGRVYVPYNGWLDGNAFYQDNLPQREMQWFGRHENTVYGSESTSDGLDIFTWDISTGIVKKLCSAPDGGACAMTQAGEILDVTLYGEILKFSSDGKLILRQQMEANAPGRVDCLIRVDENTWLGTPFITQRFWLMDTHTGISRDVGRAAPGCGEVLKTWNIGGKLYMASYANGYLTEYDPQKGGQFPENPRILTQAPGGMRPIADAQRGSQLYYACTHHYGTLGCTLTQYDAETGQCVHRDDPIPNQHIISLTFDQTKARLFAGTTFHSDCNVTTSAADTCYVAELSPDTLEVIKMLPAPKDCAYANVVGCLDEDHLLLTFSSKDGPVALWQYCLSDSVCTPLGVTLDLYNAGAPRFMGRSDIYYAGTPGLFVIKGTDSVLLCQITGRNEPEILRTILTDPNIYAIFLDSKDVCGVTKNSIYIAENALNLQK